VTFPVNPVTLVLPKLVVDDTVVQVGWVVLLWFTPYAIIPDPTSVAVNVPPP
jgi:hypothetical protein